MSTWLPRITALDLSLTATGLCHIADGTVVELTTLKVAGTGHSRMTNILDAIQHWTTGRYEPHLAVVEGPSYGSQGGQKGHHERAGLWWLVTQRLWAARTPYAVVTPSTLKKYATGKGGASKDEVLIAAVKRWGAVADVCDNNQADALALACAAAEHLGAPLADMPQAQRAALNAVDWPVLPIDDEPLAVAA